jgi:hypothetical protein
MANNIVWGERPGFFTRKREPEFFARLVLSGIVMALYLWLAVAY